MSDIGLARQLLVRAYRSASLRGTRYWINQALALMDRERPNKICTSRLVAPIGKRERRRILKLRRAGHSVPDIAIIMSVNSRAVSHIINGR